MKYIVYKEKYDVYFKDDVIRSVSAFEVFKKAISKLSFEMNHVEIYDSLQDAKNALERIEIDAPMLYTSGNAPRIYGSFACITYEDPEDWDEEDRYIDIYDVIEFNCKPFVSAGDPIEIRNSIENQTADEMKKDLDYYLDNLREWNNQLKQK